jgi:hypothetical protein
MLTNQEVRRLTRCPCSRADVLELDGGRISVTGIVLCLLTAVCCADGVVRQKHALRNAGRPGHSSDCFTSTTMSSLRDFESIGWPASTGH